MSTIKATVAVEKVWDSRANRYAMRGDVVELPAEVKDHTGKLVPIKLGDSFVLVEEKPAKAQKSKAADKSGPDEKPGADLV